jgi:aryl-alcohol dehydrogenase-like predicted oxidoreductase
MLLMVFAHLLDLYQIHRWDYNTPIEETMEALHDLIKSGKVRYIGASSMSAWQFAKAQYVAEKHGWYTHHIIDGIVILILNVSVIYLEEKVIEFDAALQMYATYHVI